MIEPRRLPAPLEVLLAFLRLGCTSFGGPIAHLGYFEHTYVRKLGWLTSEELKWNAQGALMTHSASTYQIPAIGDAPPDFRVVGSAAVIPASHQAQK